MNFFLNLTLNVSIEWVSHVRGISLFKILKRLLKKLFPILVKELSIVSKCVCFLFVQMFLLRAAHSREGCWLLQVLLSWIESLCFNIWLGVALALWWCNVTNEISHGQCGIHTFLNLWMLKVITVWELGQVMASARYLNYNK